MAKFGRGGAQVDLVLDNNQFALGDSVSGRIVIHGGVIEQTINHIEIDFMIDVVVKGQIYTHIVHQFVFDESFYIEANGRKELPFAYQLPTNLLISGNSVSYYFVTHLDIAGSVDHKDRDYITVIPPRPFERVLAAFSHIGFYEKYDSRLFTGSFQEFAFAPPAEWQDVVEEIELAGLLERDGIRLLIEVDLKEKSRERELKREIFISNETLDKPADLMEELQAILKEILSHREQYLHPLHELHPWHHASKAIPSIGGFAAGFIALEMMDKLEDVIEEMIEDEDEEQDNEDDHFDGE